MPGTSTDMKTPVGELGLDRVGSGLHVRFQIN